MQKEDRIQRLIDCIMQLPVPPEDKLRRLEALEPLIEEAYALGLTSVKPVKLMAADDLVS